MTGAGPTITTLRADSPPALLRARHVVSPREVLILSFTANFAFFEDICLGHARSSGACVTVIHDAFASPTASLDMKRAGTDYLAAPVRVRNGGAFHPKLVVIAGEDDALVAIGSGNATSSGWHHNAEIWTVMHATPTAMRSIPADTTDQTDSARPGPDYPTTFSALASWLDRLPDHLVIDPFAAARIRDTAALLTRHPATADGPDLVHNLDTPILSALPDRRNELPRGELTIASPFLDTEAAALDAVVHRLQPSSVNVALTPAAAYDAEKLSARTDKLTAAGYQVTLAKIDSERYHHGKLVQHTAGDVHRVLVGSANVTAAAMLRTASQTNGNVELGLLTDTQESLAPPTGAPLTADQVAAVAQPQSPKVDPSSEGFITAARINGHDLTITVAHVQTDRLGDAVANILGDTQPAIRLQVDDDDSPVATLRGVSTEVAGGQELQLQLSDGTTLGPVRLTNELTVVIPASTGDHLNDHDIARQSTDPAFTDRFRNALIELAAVRPVTRHASQAASARMNYATQWIADFRAAATPKVGHALLDYALATDSRELQDHTTVIIGDSDPGDASLDTGFDALLADIVASEEEFDADEEPEPAVVYQPAEAGDTTDFELSPAIKTRLRRQLTGVAEDATAWGSIAQCAVARTLFVAVADNIWSDNSWTGVVAGLARQLGSVNPDDSEAIAQLDAVRPNLRAITICATALLASAVEDDAIATPARNDRDAVLQTLETGPLALTTDDLHLASVTTLVHWYAADLPTDARLTSAGIIDTLEHLLSANPLADLADAVAEQWGAVSVEGRDLHLLQQVKNPWHAVVSILDRASALTPITAHATGPTELVTGTYVPPHVLMNVTRGTATNGALYTVAVGLSSIARRERAPTRSWRGATPPDVEAMVGQPQTRS